MHFSASRSTSGHFQPELIDFAVVRSYLDTAAKWGKDQSSFSAKSSISDHARIVRISALAVAPATPQNVRSSARAVVQPDC